MKISCNNSKDTEGDDKVPQPGIDDILQQLAGLQSNMSKLKLQLKPFESKYPIPKEEEDPKEKAMKELETEKRIFDDPTEPNAYTPRQMHAPSHYCYYATCEATLQIYSFKIAKINDNLGWPLLQRPLEVYDVVPARDKVDRRRNILFERLRDNFQQINLNGRTESEDRVLINKTCKYNICSTDNGLNIVTFENCLCTTELSLQRQHGGSVQATFLRVGGTGKGCPSSFIHRGRVACSSPPREDVAIGNGGSVSPTQVVLLDFHNSDCEKMPMGEDGSLSCQGMSFLLN
ncbi:hypothetical protein ZWY2020_006623 [Hordeum vulgare]|nr:hypothetical protein ZWY2020_006623 [Hordeum vulgare]